VKKLQTKIIIFVKDFHTMREKVTRQEDLFMMFILSLKRNILREGNLFLNEKSDLLCCSIIHTNVYLVSSTLFQKSNILTMFLYLYDFFLMRKE